MNLPTYMLLKKREEYMERYFKYNSLYRKLQFSPKLYFGGDRDKNMSRNIKYYKNMRDLYSMKSRQMNMIIDKRAEIKKFR